MELRTSLDEYKLSAELYGHSSDVRSVCPGNSSIISGSRDRTTKIWKNEGGQYFESLTLSDHKNFVSTVYYLEENGWICTGSNDSTICVYEEGSPSPFAVLKGHTSTVCSISKGIEPKTVISGSWDQTARVWTVDKSGTNFCKIILKGHEASVWAVTSLGDKFVTGSADKNIFFYNKTGEKVKALKGHTDCVRGLIGLANGTLISCGNDAVIRVWDESGKCINELHGHANYIYSMSANTFLGNDIFVTGSEDSSIRMWSLKTGALGGSMTLPAQSVWSVCCLKNGDIVTGTSDGIVRIFTKCSERCADSSALKTYETAVNAFKVSANLELGGVKANDLPGPESLLNPGREGQTRIVRQPDGKIMCYKFENNEWNCVGDVTGASGGTQATSGKTLYEGKEYDFVFSVDISDTEPPIKLPYNRGEDPWQAAQKFIHKNNLPQVYLEQVANFIIKNSNSPVIQQTNSGYADPFTGGSRYVPGSNSNNVEVSGNADPFTGGSSYTTVNRPPVQSNTNVNYSQDRFNTDPFTGGSSYSTSKTTNKYFPFSSYTSFDACDPTKVLEKLKQFNVSAENSGNQVSEDVLLAVINLAYPNPDIDRLSIDALQMLLRWPKDILFPVLDVARLAVRNEQISSLLATSEFLHIIIQNMDSTAANQLMAIRCLANMMNHLHGRNIILPKASQIVVALSKIRQGSPNLQIAIATFYLNITVSQIESADADICQTATEGLLDLMKWSIDSETFFRSMQAIGNLTCTPFGTVTVAQVISIDQVVGRIREAGINHDSEKILSCASSLLAAF